MCWEWGIWEGDRIYTHRGNLSGRGFVLRGGFGEGEDLRWDLYRKREKSCLGRMLPCNGNIWGKIEDQSSKKKFAQIGKCPTTFD